MIVEKFFIIYSVICVNLIPLSYQEYFTALVHLEKLLDTEKNAIDVLNRYLDNEKKRLSSLKQMTDRYYTSNSIAKQDVDTYLSNPVNAYLLVKRLTSDWKLVEHLINNDQKSLIHFFQQNETFPSADDLSGAAEALLRLQNTYKLNTSMLADGFIPVLRESFLIDLDLNKSTNLSLPLTSNDCFELGKQAYYNQDFHKSELWMKEALKRLDQEIVDGASNYMDTRYDRVQILNYLALCHFKLGFLREAYGLTSELLKIDPDHEQAKIDLEYFRVELEIKKRSQTDTEADNEQSNIQKMKVIDKSALPTLESEHEIYEALCRGESRLSISYRSKLKCFYLETKKLDPYIRLWKVQVEEMFRKPQLVMFHQFLSDNEIKVIKTLSEPKLQRATVQNYYTGKPEHAKYRISKSSWLTDEQHEVVYRVSRRIEALTNLDMKTAEQLQVVNYGIGGHYEPHFDYASPKEDKFFRNNDNGNRIATWLNYMSDVTAGGSTVFPKLGVTVWPIKGSAAFWYNLFKSSEGDPLTRHAACPVLIGSKWVSNKWIHQVGQEFRKPCGRSKNQRNIVQHI